MIFTAALRNSGLEKLFSDFSKRKSEIKGHRKVDSEQPVDMFVVTVEV